MLLFKPSFFRDSSPQKKRPIVIVISGIIGAGKSTLIKLLGGKLSRSNIKTVIVNEPVEDWKDSGLLEAYYKDISRMAYTFQAEVFRSRIMAILKAYEDNPDAEIILMERSPWDDKIFMEMLHDDKKITELEWSLYLGWCNLWERLLPLTPNAFVLLDPSVGTCQKRVFERKRSGEEMISDDYQIKLKTYHDRYFSSGGLASSFDSLSEGRFKEGEVEETTAMIGSLLVPCYHVVTEDNFRDHAEAQEKIMGIFEKIVKIHS